MRKLLLVSLLALSACATPAPSANTSQRTDVTCANGRAFSVRYTSQGNAEVFAAGQVYHLPGVVAASGTRYTDGRVEYWEHHGDAMLNGATGGPYEACKTH